MNELWIHFWTRVFEVMTDRVDGPFRFRLVLQPTIATVIAIRSGLKDARLGRPPYFWALMTDPVHRAEMAKDGWRSVGKVFILAMVLDIVFQLIVVHTVYPAGVVFVAFVLAIIPYLILRGTVTRIANRFMKLRSRHLH
ncbi:hypothetical protein [Paraburkholderia rhizosphaerae]|uniref:Uncharacterized protein n=1 Tax=Paraburkholderia rhizosphaerae TaxID=480658 RepID=A0A4R8LZK4_9BURK|nr:hypothetical protein [Paraburkholderia rhizosphaerae]TDY54117.1 hypothetical protein BX592_102264 [Paraburkholderia rhizosphaerae]